MSAPDSSARNSGARDSGARDSGARDSAARDSSARDSAARNSAASPAAAAESFATGRGPLAPVVFVHGLRTSASMWRSQLETLRGRGIRAEAVDLPGHGRRMHERFTLDSASQTIDEAVDAATAATGTAPYLVGFSLGGYLSIDWVSRHPGRICGLLAASCGTVPNRVILDGWRVLARGIHLFPDRGLSLNNLAVRAFVPKPGSDDVIAGGVALEVMDDVLRQLRGLHPVDSLSVISEPVLFVNGRLDHIRWHAARYLAATANGRLVTVPGATHMVSVARPREFTAALLEGYAEAASRLPDPSDDW